MWNRLYNPQSFCDKGTLKQLANLINRPKLPKKVKQDFRAVQDFFDVVLDAHITAAALKFFSMDKLEDTLKKNAFSGDLTAATAEEKRRYLSQCMDMFISRFAHQHVQSIEGDSETPSDGTEGKEDESITDGIFEYACSVTALGLMARNFADATRDGDGPRLVRCWKFLMLHFKADGRTKYAVEAFNLISKVNATLTPQMACRLIWNRTCNPKGGEGNNVSLDLRNEHLNRTFKDNINTFRANISDKSVARSSQSDWSHRRHAEGSGWIVSRHQVDGTLALTSKETLTPSSRY